MRKPHIMNRLKRKKRKESRRPSDRCFFEKELAIQRKILLPAKDLTVSRFKSELFNREKITTYENFAIMGEGVAYNMASRS